MDIIRMKRLADFIKTRKAFDYTDTNVEVSGYDVERQGFDVDSLELLDAPEEFCMGVFYGKKGEIPVGCLAACAAHLQVAENSYVYKSTNLVPYNGSDPELNEISSEAASRGRTYLGLTHDEAVSLFAPWGIGVYGMFQWTPVTPEEGARAIMNAVKQYEQRGTFCASIWDHVEVK